MRKEERDQSELTDLSARNRFREEAFDLAETRIILDVDTGIDDALAILYALKRPGLTVEGITTVFGNIDVVSATRNTLQILELAGRTDVPVARGARDPLVENYIPRSTPGVHGGNGLGDIELPLPRIQPIAQHAVDFIIEKLRANPGQITLVPVGRMTNIALALQQAPEIAQLAKACVLMGGAVTHPGNTNAVAEANILGDPEAARVLFRSGMRITMVGLDVTMRAVLTTEALDAIAAQAGKIGPTIAAITRHYIKFYGMNAPQLGGCALHDPLAVEVAVDPSVVRTELRFVDVETRGELTRGMTVTDRRTRPDRPAPNANVCVDLDAPRFLQRFHSALVSYMEV